MKNCAWRGGWDNLSKRISVDKIKSFVEELELVR
jgi:hypothetical protein